MSLSLTLVFAWHDHTILSYSRLAYPSGNMDAVRDAIDPLAIPLDDCIEWYGDAGLESRESDAYNNPLTYLPAGRLAPILAKAIKWTDGWGFAVATFVRDLPPGTRVVLYWC